MEVAVLAPVALPSPGRVEAGVVRDGVEVHWEVEEPSGRRSEEGLQKENALHPSTGKDTLPKGVGRGGTGWTPRGEGSERLGETRGREDSPE